jgi:hypothetical protein
MTPAGDNPGPKDTTDLQANIDSLLRDVAQTTGRIEQHVASMPALDGPPGAEDLASQVDTLLGKTPAHDPVAAIESLDAQLAELTAQLLDSRPDAEARDAAPPPPPTPVPIGSASATITLSATSEHTQPEPPLPQPPGTDTAPTNQPGLLETSTKPAPVAPAASPMPAATPPPAPAPPPVDRVSAAESAALSEPLPAEDPTPTNGPVFNFLAAISRPIAAKPASFRMMLGILGAGNLALALAAWGLVLLREPPKPAESPAFNFGADVLPRPVEPRPVEAPAKAAEKPAPSGGH